MKRIVIVLFRNGQNLTGQWDTVDAHALRASFGLWLQKEAMGKSAAEVDRIYENEDEETSIDLSEVIAVVMQDPERNRIAIPQIPFVPRN